ncbi:MAG: hypothetical protein LDLANPLL_00838 [Turneriella sp.]|nr:hypothetical protein [Turneriella sp.]
MRVSVIKDGNAVQFSINQNFTQRAGSSFKHVFVGTQRLLTKRAEADNHREPLQWFYHTDHLQSTSYLTNSRGDLEEYLAYFPYGETWVEEHPSMPIDYQFSAKELDEETGLYYFGARYLDPRVGTWVSVDPALMEYLPSGDNKANKNTSVYQSRSLGLFSYAANNPLLFIDPDGRDVAIFRDREAAGGQGHIGMAVFENGGKGQVTYMSYGPASSGKPMVQTFKNTAAFTQYLNASTYGDNPQQGNGFNYDDVVVLSTSAQVDTSVINAGRVEISQNRWSLFGNLFGEEFNDPDVNCKDMVRNSLGVSGIPLANRMKPNNWQNEVVQQSNQPRNAKLQNQLQTTLNNRNAEVTRQRQNLQNQNTDQN